MRSFKLTSSGLTVIELLVASGVGTVLTVAVGAFMVQQQRSSIVSQEIQAVSELRARLIQQLTPARLKSNILTVNGSPRVRFTLPSSDSGQVDLATLRIGGPGLYLSNGMLWNDGAIFRDGARGGPKLVDEGGPCGGLEGFRVSRSRLVALNVLGGEIYQGTLGFDCQRNQSLRSFSLKYLFRGERDPSGGQTSRMLVDVLGEDEANPDGRPSCSWEGTLELTSNSQGESNRYQPPPSSGGVVDWLEDLFGGGATPATSFLCAGPCCEFEPVSDMGIECHSGKVIYLGPLSGMPSYRALIDRGVHHYSLSGAQGMQGELRSDGVSAHSCLSQRFEGDGVIYFGLLSSASGPSRLVYLHVGDPFRPSTQGASDDGSVGCSWEGTQIFLDYKGPGNDIGLECRDQKLTAICQKPSGGPTGLMSRIYACTQPDR